MFENNSSFIDFSSTSLTDIKFLFNLTQQLKNQFKCQIKNGKQIQNSEKTDLENLKIDLEISNTKLGNLNGDLGNLNNSNLTKLNSESSRTQVGVLAFFEPSTRTRISFEMACHRSGVKPILLDSGQSSSLEKGETLLDSILNLAAMEPDFIVIRCNADLNLREISQLISVPIINGGWGTFSHPTQALLDIFTLWEHWGEIDLKNKKLLIVGDVKHSRVASSHFELAQKMGYQVAQCGPREYLNEKPGIKVFEKLEEGLEWADAVMALRFQFERHQNISLNQENYQKEFGINTSKWAKLNREKVFLHPGPINHGIEVTSEVLKLPDSLVLAQVNNGVFIREALLRKILM